RDLLVAAPTIGGDTAYHTHERGAALVDAVEHPELQRRKLQEQDEVDGQHGGHHLGRYVGEEAREPQKEHRAADRRHASPPAGATRPEERAPTLCLVHSLDTRSAG